MLNGPVQSKEIGDYEKWLHNKNFQGNMLKQNWKTCLAATAGRVSLLDLNIFLFDIIMLPR